MYVPRLFHVLIALILLAVSIWIVIHINELPKDDIFTGIFSIIIVPVLIGAMLILLTSFVEKNSENLEGFIKKKVFRTRAQYRIYLFGVGASGKTTLIERWSLGHVDNVIATSNIKVYKIPITGNREAVLFDYSGQKPSQAILDAPQEVIGKPGERKVQSAIFLVDLVGLYDDDDNLLNTFDKQYNWMQSDTISKIRKRADEHKDYIFGSTAETIISLIRGKELRSIYFVINKCDVIEALIDNGYISIPSGSDRNSFLLDFFKPITEQLREITDNNLLFLSSSFFISAKRGDSTTQLLNEIIDRIERTPRV